MKKVSGLFILIMLLAFVLTGCGAANSNGELPAGIAKSVTNSAQKAADSSELKSAGQSTDQELTNTEAAAHTSQESSTQPSQTVQSNSDNQESKLPSAMSQPSSSDSSSGDGAVLTPAAPPVSLTLPTAPVPKPNTNAQNIVTFSINCQTFIDKGLQAKEQFKDAVPADGIIMPPMVVEFKEGEVVFDILKQVVRQYKIHMEYEGSKGTPYIEGISNLYEFDGGPLSGWMYCVNKVYPNYGCGEYKLKSGDVIEWNYTCDLGKDLGQTWLGE